MQILVLRLSSLGDVVLASSFLESLAEHFPGARATFVVRADLAEIASALPNVERVVAVERDLGPLGLAALGRDLARGAWAHVFDLHRSLRSRLLTLGLRGRLRPSFHKQELPRWLLVHTKHDLYGRFGGAQPLRERMLEPLRRLGLEPRLHPTRLVLPAGAEAEARAALAGAGVLDGETLVALAPGARWPSKCWPVERWTVLAARLGDVPGRRLLLVGGPADRTTTGIVALGHRQRAVDLAGRLGILGTAAALARCSAVVANDSGLVHVAEAVGRPVVALFGPTSPQFGYAPYRAASRLVRRPPPCSPCSKNGSRPCMRPTHECMENVSVEDVQAALEAVLREPAANVV